ncbi:MAG: hypothetical protein KDB07_06740, partial [Planctomycetes bacterium]|nr:hypothetical protein [Planctomycetota bacterium]
MRLALAPALCFAILFASSLRAHQLEFNTSLLQLHTANSAAVIAESREVRGKGVELDLISVFKMPARETLSAGSTIAAENLQQGVDPLPKGVLLVFLEAIAIGDKTRWVPKFGPYLATPSERATFDKSGKIEVLGLSLSEQTIRDALIEHSRINPALAQGFVDAKDSLRANELVGERTHSLLGDQRLNVYSDWLKSENPVLALDALVGAYEIAELLLPFESLAPPRLLPYS